MSSSARIDFYSVLVPPNSPPFESLILSDHKSNDDETRTVRVGSYSVRLQSASSGSAVIEGEMIRLQMDNHPAKGTLNGRVSPLGLPDGVGICGETAFLYQPSIKVLALHRGRNGVSARMIAGYFEQKGGLDGMISLAPVLQPDAVKRIAAMKEARKLTIQFAGVTNPAFFRDAGASFGGMVDLLERFSAPRAEFTLSMGHQSGSLNLRNIVDLVKQVFNAHPQGEGEVSKLVVSGVHEGEGGEDEKDVLDLMNYRLVEAFLKPENANSNSDYTARRGELKKAWARRRAELESMFGGGNDGSR